MENSGYGYDQGAPAATPEQVNFYANQNEEKQAPPPNVDPAYNAQQNPPYPTQGNPPYPTPQNPGYPTQQTPGYPAQQTPGYPAPQPTGYAVQQNGSTATNPNYGVTYPAQPGTVGYSAGANTVVITQPGAYGYAPHATGYMDNTGAIIFSCAVSWCCCFICGIAAFVFALMAGTSTTTNDAKRKNMISTRLSIAGLITGILIWLLVIILIIVAAAS